MLNLVGAIEESTGGRIEVAGKDIASLQGKERTAYGRDRVGFVFRFFNLVPTLTALETSRSSPNSPARASAQSRGAGAGGPCPISPTDSRSTVRRSAATGGNRACLVREPPLLLCHEPTGGLDLATANGR